MEEHMEMKLRAERQHGVSVRKKVKQLLAIALAVLMVNPVTGYCVAICAADSTNVNYLGAKGENLNCTSATEVAFDDYAWGNVSSDKWYVVKGNITISNSVNVFGNVHLILTDGSSLTVGKGIGVFDPNSLTIYGQTQGTGTIITTGSDEGGAGIGGTGYSVPSGSITINGGNIIANGGDRRGCGGAGIGGGYCAGGNVTINGGIITATGCNGGAGIGGGYAGTNTTTEINGGIITATGGNSYGGTGIGGGYGGGGGNITINGGKIEAIGKYSCAGIGSGYLASGGFITIRGGSVNALGNDGGAGIGDGYSGNGASIYIHGGTVTATGGTVTTNGYTGGAGIGGGYNEGSGNIVITGGTITASGKSGGAGIGGSVNGWKTGITITGGMVTATGSTKGSTGSIGGAGIGRGEGLNGGYTSGYGIFKTKSYDILGSAVIVAVSGNTTPAISDTSERDSWSGVIFEGSSGEVYGNQTLNKDFTITTDNTLTISGSSSLTVGNGSILTNNGTINNSGSLTIIGDVTGSGILNGSGIVNKKAQPTAPSFPTLDSATSDSITLNAIIGGAGVQYCKDNGAWQESPTFSSLSPNTTYMFCARYGGNSYYEASPSSSSVDIKTLPVTYKVAAQSNNTTNGMVEGGGTYYEGTQVTLTAIPRMGCTFEKWTSDAEGNTQVSTDKIYAFTPTNSSTYYAWFKNDIYTLTVGNYNTSAGYVTDIKPEGYVYNETAVLTAVTNSGYTFDGWKNEYGLIESTEVTLSIQVSGNMTITPVFTQTQADTTYYTVAFYHQSGSLLKSERVATNGTVTPPNTPSKAGYEFKGWTTDGTNVVALDSMGSITITSDMTFKPLFEKKTVIYSLTVNGANTTYAPLSSVTAQAVAIPEGKQFAYWTDADGNTVSYSNPYTFLITGDVALTAVYVDAITTVTQEPTLTLSNVTYEQVSTGKHKMLWYASMDLPVGYTLIESGILRVVSTAAQKTDQMTFDTAGIYRRIIQVSDSLPDQYYYSVTAADGKGVSVRAYIVVKDSEGNLETIYSDAQYGYVNQ